MDPDSEWPSIAPEHMLCALLLQLFYSGALGAGRGWIISFERIYQQQLNSEEVCLFTRLQLASDQACMIGQQT
jgi:hypothetical protein